VAPSMPLFNLVSKGSRVIIAEKLNVRPDLYPVGHIIPEEYMKILDVLIHI